MLGDVAIFKRDLLLRKILFHFGAEQSAGLTVQDSALPREHAIANQASAHVLSEYDKDFANLVVGGAR